MQSGSLMMCGVRGGGVVHPAPRDTEGSNSGKMQSGSLMMCGVRGGGVVHPAPRDTEGSNSGKMQSGSLMMCGSRGKNGSPSPLLLQPLLSGCNGWTMFNSLTVTYNLLTNFRNSGFDVTVLPASIEPYITEFSWSRCNIPEIIEHVQI